LRDIRDLLAKEIEIRKDAQENLEEGSLTYQRTPAKNEELELSNHELQPICMGGFARPEGTIRKIEIFVKLLGERCLNDEPNGPIMCVERFWPPNV
jgi:hypothetical protein